MLLRVCWLLGSIPTSFSMLSNLVTLHLHNNPVTGRVECVLSCVGIGFKSELVVTAVLHSNNEQLGSIPLGFDRLINMYDLILDNALTGTSINQHILLRTYLICVCDMLSQLLIFPFYLT